MGSEAHVVHALAVTSTTDIYTVGNSLGGLRTVLDDVAMAATRPIPHVNLS